MALFSWIEPNHTFVRFKICGQNLIQKFPLLFIQKNRFLWVLDFVDRPTPKTLKINTPRKFDMYMFFQHPLNIPNNVHFVLQILGLEDEQDFVTIKYAYGMAAIATHTYKVRHWVYIKYAYGMAAIATHTYKVRQWKLLIPVLSEAKHVGVSVCLVAVIFYFVGVPCLSKLP